MLTTGQKIGLGVITVGATVQYISNLALLKENNKQRKRYAALREEHVALVDIANKSLYMAAYLSMILGKNGVEMSAFDKQVLCDPPGIFGGDIPTLFEQAMDDPDFLAKLIADPPEDES